ncbi:MAG: phosphatase PAP2 family protein [Steroidobacteraceae bacterium]
MRFLHFALLLLALAAGTANAGGGPLGIDHEIGFDRSGIWARKYQTALEVGTIVTEIGGALWLGNDDELGHVFWQTIDSSAITGIAATVLKRATGRARPNQGNNPNRWFRGSCCQSFPSGEVSLQASFVTPFIVHQASEHPWIWALELLPVYDGIARLKSHAHWQSDVIAGWLLGSAIGYWTAKRDLPFSVAILPGEVTIGFSKRF